jgi:hypothetical protein
LSNAIGDKILGSEHFLSSSFDVSTGTEIVTFHLGNNIFHIPRNYLISGSDVPRPNDQGGFILQVLLPDLAPRTSENQDIFSERRIGTGRRIIISINYNITLLPARDVISRTLSVAKKDEKDFEMTPAG